MQLEQNSKVAIVADWIIGGGAERVVEQLHKQYPEAPIYTSYCTKEWRRKLGNKVITGWLQHPPFGLLRKYIGVLRIPYFKSLKLDDYDVVISCTGNGEAKFIQTRADAKHICYCFTPTHFYWRHYQTYIDNPGFGLFNPLARLGLKVLVGPLRKADYKAAQKPDQMIAISDHIKSDIKQYYGRDAIVIHPPVDTERFAKRPKTKRQGFITVGRQTPYKKTELLIEACTKLDEPLKIVGRGPEHQRLISLASNKTEFISGASDAEVNKLLSEAKGFIFAAEEDFGIAPVEALASGTPVIAYGRGGALDFVKPGKNGLMFDEQTVDSLVDAIKTFNKQKFDPKTVTATAESFSAKTFETKIEQQINN